MVLANRTAGAPSGAMQARPKPAASGVGVPGGVLGTVLPYGASVIFVAVLGTALWKSGITQANVFSTVPFILAVQISAFAWGRGPAIIAAVAGAVVMDYYWVGPPYEFDMPTAPEWFLFAVLLAIALTLGTVTDRMRVARRQAEDLAASEQLERALLNSISHDLRTPLTAIMGTLSTLIAEKGPVGRLDAAAREELLSIAYDRAKTLDGLVGQILEMTKLEAGVLRIQTEPATIHNLVALALRAAGDPVRQRCRVAAPPDAPLVPMDAVLLSHAIGNVIDNAARYSPQDSVIEVDAAVASREIVLSVADRGPGIPPADFERVFEKFYRVHTDGAGGVGLGLAIAKGIVEAHGGRIWAERRAGGGTVVRLALPLA